MISTYVCVLDCWEEPSLSPGVCSKLKEEDAIELRLDIQHITKKG